MTSCKTCKNTGTIQTIVHWSDGDGLADARCPDCNPEPKGPITQTEYDAEANSELRKIVEQAKARRLAYV